MNKRRVFIIDSRFQYNFIARNLAMILITAVFAFVLLVVWNVFRFNQDFLMLTPSAEQLLRWAKEHNLPTDGIDVASQFIAQAKRHSFAYLVTVPLVVAVLLNALLSVFTSIYFSHHMAGPLHRIKNALRDKLDGKAPDPIVLRNGDMFGDLARLVNEVLESDKNGKAER